MKDKKMYRTAYNKMISGVCNGIAEYFDADVSLVRLIFVLGAFYSGWFLILYIALNVILPVKRY